MTNLQYAVPDSLVGKTLWQIQNDPSLGFNNLAGIGQPKLNPSQLGLADYNTPLGKNLSYSTNDPGYTGSGEFASLNKIFGNALTPEQLSQQAQKKATSAALEAAGQFRDFNIESNQPRVTQLQSGKTDLKSRYAEILAGIKGTEQTQTDTATLNTARELGRRGITGGGVYDTEHFNSQNQVARQFAPIRAEAGMREAQDVKGIDDLIASLLAGNPEQATSAGFNTAQLGQNAAQFAQTLLQQQAQSQADSQYKRDSMNQAMEIAKMGAFKSGSTASTSDLLSLWNSARGV